MTLIKKTYTAADVPGLVFQASPVSTILLVILTVMRAAMPTAAVALTTANFVDTATAILRGDRPHDAIYLPLILLLLVLGISVTLNSVIQLINSRINLGLQRTLKPAVVEKHAALEYKHIEKAESWELISRVSRDPVKSLTDGFSAYTQFIQIIISVTSVLVLIFTQAWWSALAILAFSVPMFRLSMLAGKRNYKAARESEKFNRRTEYLDEVLTTRDNIDERTLFGYGGDVGKRWQDQFNTGRIIRLKVGARMFLVTKGSSMSLALISLLTALALIDPVTTGHLSAGMYMGLVSAVFGMINQLGWTMTDALEKISGVREYMKDLTAFTALSESADALTGPDAMPLEFRSLEFRNVSFKYPGGGNYVLNNMSFILNAGIHYAFVGRNGAGKTTVTKLLTGLYTEYEGEILINERELREYPAGTLKAFSSAVFQDFAKYYISMKDNIALGDISGTDAGGRAAEAARMAGLEETIAGLKDGIETPLGKILENGQDISGGQWQRVAIARSLTSRAPVKILDEPTAALDPVSESRVYEEFEKLMAGRTTIFISHRLGSTKLADEIIVIDNGRIAERGSHSELMNANGQYAEMFESQREWYK